MIPLIQFKGSLVLVAISGGPDSTALLHVLHSHGCKLHAVHLDHGLRPEAADDAAYVQQLCESLAIPYTLGTADVAAEKKRRGGSVQEVARAVRYEFLEKTADEVGADFIATAHNQDDRIETVLLNIIRGTGTDGLRGIPYRRGRIIRPMLDVSRAEVEEYCREHGLAPRQDESNLSTKYSRNEIRLKLIPYLEERFNSNVGGAILRLSQIAADESDYLEEIACDWLGNDSVIDVNMFKLLPLVLQRRVLRLWLRTVCQVADADMDLVEKIRVTLCKSWKATLPGNLRVINNGVTIWREVPENQRASIPYLNMSQPIAVPGTISISSWRITAAGSLPLCVNAVVRFWKGGDRMPFPFGHRKLSDIFGEAKVPREERWSTPLLVDEATNEVFAIANLRVSPLAPDLTFAAERLIKA